MEDATFEYVKRSVAPTLKLTKSAAPAKSPYFISINSLYDLALIVDTNGRIIVANAKAERRLGSVTGKLIGSHITDVIKNASKDLFKMIMANVAEKQYTIMEAVCIGSNGKSFIAEIAISPEQVEPTKGICFLIRDITSRAEAEAKLKTISQAVYNANYGIIILDENLHIEFCNPAFFEIIKKISGKDVKIMEGEDIRTFLKLPNDLFEQAIQANTSTEVEFAGPTEEETIKLRINSVPNTDETGSPIGIILFCEDISLQAKLDQERRKAEEQRILANQWQERLKKLSDLTYAINNPLQALLGKAELENRIEEKNLILQIVGVLKEYIQYEKGLFETNEVAYSPLQLDVLTSLVPSNRDMILLVEDDKNVADIFVRIISKNYPHITICNAFTGKEGIEKFSQYHPAIIILDINIPEMDGIELYKSIKTISERNMWEEPNIIFCTGFSVPAELAKIISKGDKNILLTKPITGSILLKAIERYIVKKEK